MEKSPCLNLFKDTSCNLINVAKQAMCNIWLHQRKVVIGVVTLTIAIKAHNCYKRQQRRKKWNAVGKDVIVLHGINRAKTCPNLSPFVIKLETFLRMANLKYEFDSEEPFGPKTKTPWITINGTEIADSDLIIDFLRTKFNLNFNSALTNEKKGIARAMAVMVNEHLLWGLADWRFAQDKDLRVLDLMHVPLSIRCLLRFKKDPLKAKKLAQGIGHHSAKEIEGMMLKDIEAVSLFLGDKPFLMGNEPCEEDCSVFGMMAQLVWGAPGSPYAAAVQSDYRNLLNYCFRMRDKFYPDWEKCLA